jgi:DNA-binding NtrC family response regulator
MNNIAQKFGKDPMPISDRMIQECMRYHWPGNLRELGNFVKRYLVLEQENLLIEELQAKSKGSGSRDILTPSSTDGGLKALVRSLKDDAEAKEILRVLEDAGWNRKVAASRLRISYKALLYKIQQHGLMPADEREGRRLTAANAM